VKTRWPLPSRSTLAGSLPDCPNRHCCQSRSRGSPYHRNGERTDHNSLQGMFDRTEDGRATLRSDLNDSSASLRTEYRGRLARSRSGRERRPHRIEEGTGRHRIGLLSEMDEGELRSAVDTNVQIQIAFCRLHLGDIDMEEADRTAFKLLLRRLVALSIRQSGDAVALQATMQ
jgi:hypothetical protein